MGPRSSDEPDGPHAIDRLAEYFSGSLTPADDLAVEAHLLACADCRAEYDELGQIALMVAWQRDDSPQ